MALETFLPSLASQLGEISGIEAVHYPHPDQGEGNTGLPGKLSVFPCFVIVPRSGTQMFGGPNIATHILDVTLYVTAQVLPENYGQAIPYIAKTRDKLAGRIKLGLAYVEHCIPAPGNFYEGPGAITYAGSELLGIKFQVEVKETVTGLTVAA